MCIMMQKNPELREPKSSVIPALCSEEMHTVCSGAVGYINTLEIEQRQAVFLPTGCAETPDTHRELPPDRNLTHITPLEMVESGLEAQSWSHDPHQLYCPHDTQVQEGGTEHISLVTCSAHMALTCSHVPDIDLLIPFSALPFIIYLRWITSICPSRYSLHALP